MSESALYVQYEIIDSLKYGRFPEELSLKCRSDLSREHRSLSVNRGYMKSITGNGSFRYGDYNIRYLYVLSMAFSAGSGKYLEYSVKYAGTGVFRSVLFDVMSRESGRAVYRIYEVPKLGRNKSFKLHVPFDPDVNIPETCLIIRGLSKDKTLSM